MVDDVRKSTLELSGIRADQDDRPGRAVTGHWRERFVRLAYRFLWNWSDAEDAVQEAMVLAETKQAQVKEEKKWWAWVTRIVINQCRQVHRQRRRSEEFRRSLPEGRNEPQSRHETRIEQKELAEILKKLIVELPDRQRTAIVLRHLEGLDYEEIARIMEVSESSVRVHVHSGREALREMILARYPEWAGAEL